MDPFGQGQLKNATFPPSMLLCGFKTTTTEMKGTGSDMKKQMIKLIFLGGNHECAH
jgi:hypothetical protein